jgi:hypothetical protein
MHVLRRTDTFYGSYAIAVVDPVDLEDARPNQCPVQDYIAGTAVSHPATYFCSRQAHLLPQNLRKGISPVDYYIALDPVDKETLLDHFSSAPFKFFHPNPVLSSFISLKSHTQALAFFHETSVLRERGTYHYVSFVFSPSLSGISKNARQVLISF